MERANDAMWPSSIGKRSATTASDALGLEQRLGQCVTVLGGAAEEGLRGLRAPVVQMRVVLPGEADAAVDLDVVGGCVGKGVGAVGLRQGRDHRHFLRAV